MEIYLDRRAVRQIRSAARDAIEDGANDALPEEIVDAFADRDVRIIEQRLDGGELFDFIATMLDDWGGDDVDELFELLESSFAEIGLDLSSEYRGEVDDTEVLEVEDDFPAAEPEFDGDEEDDDDEDDDDEDEGDEEREPAEDDD